MPIIPTKGDTRRQLRPAPTGYQSARGATDEAFGAGVGNAVAALGQSFSQVGGVAADIANDMQERENARNAAEANTALADDLRALAFGDGQSEGYYHTQGGDAVSAYKKAQSEVDRLIQAHGKGLNTNARRRYDAAAKQRRESTLNSFSNHALQQRTVAEDAATQALRDTAINDAVLDGSKLSESLDTIEEATVAEGERKGWSDEVLAANIVKEQSRLLEGVISATMQTDLPRAFSVFNAAVEEGMLDGPTAAKLEKAFDIKKRSVIAAQERAERKADKELKERQETNAAQAFDRIIEDDITPDGLDYLLQNNLIDGDQFRTLRGALDNEQEPEDDPLAVVDAYEKLDNGELTVRDVLDEYQNGRLSRSTAKELRGRLDKEVDPLNADAAKRARSFVRDNVGGVRGPLAVLDTEASQREAAAIRAYDNLVKQGVDPFEAADRIVKFYKPRSIGSGKPMFLQGTRANPDIPATARRTREAYDAGVLTDQQLQEELAKIEALAER